VPAQHWSRRFAWDTNASWWCGWVLEGSRRVYVAGDTAFFSGFQQIANRFPALDLAVLPIGAYDPQALLRMVHMNPEEAGAAWAILQAKAMLPMHYGTFLLSDEPIGEPLARLQRWWRKYNLDPKQLWLPAVGKTRTL
jgi:L-ascorbate metabolism protein UlaG (beta-lactamase superfamily)